MAEQELILVARAKLLDMLQQLNSVQGRLIRLPASVAMLSVSPATLPDALRELAEIQSVLATLVTEVATLSAGQRAGGPPVAAVAADPGAFSNAAQETAPTPAHATPAPWTSLAAPLVLRGVTSGAEALPLPTNGIDLRTGGYLLEIDAAAAASLAAGQTDPVSLRQLQRLKQQSQDPSFGLVHGYSDDLLADARWAVVVHADEPAELLRALRPLIVRRAEEQGITADLSLLDVQSGETCARWYSRVIGDPDKHRANWNKLPPVLIYRGERGSETTVGRWLARHGVSAGPVDPLRGVPYYLMLAARPGPLHAGDEIFIPFEFQYELDLFWGVGRLCLTDENGRHDYAAYEHYAEQVVAFEQHQEPASLLEREIVYFGTRHQNDLSTELSVSNLVLPLYQWHTENRRTGPGALGFARRLLLADGQPIAGAAAVQPDGKADKRALYDLLHRRPGGLRPPALLFTAGHGAGLTGATAADTLALQGALLTQDAQLGRPVAVEPEVFAGADLTPDAAVRGMIAFLFACYGAGSPTYDEFVFVAPQERPQIAPFPFVARLPQQLLRRGALAVLGHVERAWTYSFRGTDSLPSQSQGFEDVLSRLATGKRVGFATDQFNVRQASFGLRFGDELENIRFGKRLESYELSRLWMARNDARNYMVLGDPAVRLPFRPPAGS